MMSSNLLFSRWRLPLTVASLTLALAGCAHIPDLSPEAQMLNADKPEFSNKKSTNSNSLSEAQFPTLMWWSRLGDPQLNALIEEALEDNPSLASADARLRQAEAQAGIIDAKRQFSMDASARASGMQLPKNMIESGGKIRGSQVLTLGLNYDLDLFGGKRAQWEAAVGKIHAAEVDSQAARLRLAASVAQTYIQLANAFALLDVAERDVQRSNQLLVLSQQRVSAGLDNELQLRNAETRIATAKQQKQQAEHQIEIARNALAALLGKGSDRGLSITKPMVLNAETINIPDVLPSELLGHRPDIVAARWRIEAANKTIYASKVAFKPSINLSATLGLVGSNPAQLFKSGAVLGLAGPALSLPIFDGGHLRSELASSYAQFDSAVADYNQNVITAIHEVTDAIQTTRALEQQIHQLDTAQQAAQAAWNLAQHRYQSGLGNQLDVLSAQLPLLQIEQQRTQLISQRLSALVDLNQALGGGVMLSSPSSSIDVTP